jgi:hypothetical protein
MQIADLKDGVTRESDWNIRSRDNILPNLDSGRVSASAAV